MNTFGIHMKGLRLTKYLTVKQLAVKAKLTSECIRKIERGVLAGGRPDTLRKLAVALDANYIDLLIAAGHMTAQDVTDWLRGGPND